MKTNKELFAQAHMLLREMLSDEEKAEVSRIEAQLREIVNNADTHFAFLALYPITIEVNERMGKK